MACRTWRDMEGWAYSALGPAAALRQRPGMWMTHAWRLPSPRSRLRK